MNLNTRFRKKTLLIISGLALGFASSSTLAQVAPPPTKPAKEQPDYKPAPKATPKPAAKPAAPKPKPAMNATRSRGDVVNLPITVPYPKLAKKGPDGRILRLRQLPDIAAMRSNPNIGPKSVEKIMPIVYSRRYRMELKIIDNLDLYWQLTGGLLENMNMSDITEMSQAAEMIKPLIGETTLSQELLNRNILTRVQGGMNQYIVREYKKAITDEIQVLEGEKGLEEVMRFVLEDSIHETINTYNAMIAEALSQISTLVEDTNAQSSEAIALRGMEKPLSDESIRQFEDLQIFDSAFRKLPYEEAMAIFQAMREAREFPSLSPTVQKINVLHDRKIVSDSGFELLAKDPKSGRVIDTRKRDKDGKPLVLDAEGNEVVRNAKPEED
ncbi:MAG: hypothetical protein P1U42_08250 [Phycisphaerales bacterium]|jgi:hypothetical protein|nr:hypothetical protein [Phycisphaerales bacterium]